MTADDGSTKSNDEFADDVRKSGAEHLTSRHLATDHSYSDQGDAFPQNLDMAGEHIANGEVAKV